MMKEDKIYELIDRFLNGETKADEERMLYDYFQGKNVAKELRKYQSMFQWYANGMPEDELIKRSKTYPVVKRIRLATIGVAASMLILIGVGVWKHQKMQEEYAIYEGSYIVRDGKKLTNIKEILPELKAVERQVGEMIEQKNINKEIPTI
ncbi:MAG: hypothetical protein II576_12290 [Prevotella sp.]|nr:hypothetical protein [Prevotella sp.]